MYGPHARSYGRASYSHSCFEHQTDNNLCFVLPVTICFGRFVSLISDLFFEARINMPKTRQAKGSKTQNKELEDFANEVDKVLSEIEDIEKDDQGSGKDNPPSDVDKEESDHSSSGQSHKSVKSRPKKKRVSRKARNKKEHRRHRGSRSRRHKRRHYDSDRDSRSSRRSKRSRRSYEDYSSSSSESPERSSREWPRRRKTYHSGFNPSDFSSPSTHNYTGMSALDEINAQHLRDVADYDRRCLMNQQQHSARGAPDYSSARAPYQQHHELHGHPPGHPHYDEQSSHPLGGNSGSTGSFLTPAEISAYNDVIKCGEDVMPKIREAIMNDIYFDFNDLIIANAEGQTPNQNLPKKQMSITQWNRCFRKFMTHYVPSHLHLADALTLQKDMFTHVDNVLDIFLSGGKWLNYDSHVRQLQCIKYSSWAAQRINLLIKHNTNFGAPAAFGGGGAKPSYQGKKIYVPNGRCVLFHTGKKCNMNCGFNHTCFKCDKSQHPAVKCRAGTAETVSHPKNTVGSSTAPNAKSGNKNTTNYSVVTPISYLKLKYLLQKTKYDTAASRFLVDGFQRGFSIGHAGNLNSVIPEFTPKEHEKDIIQEKIDKELALGRVGGPFNAPPFDNFKISPIFLRPKAVPGQYRMILDLSYPKNEESINANIPTQWRSVIYSSVRDAVKIIASKPGCFSSKIDVKDAFRLIPIKPDEFNKLCFMHDGRFYYEKVLPQGCGSSCYLFDKFSSALKHIFTFFAPDCGVVHYLDDFLLIADSEELCLRYQKLFITICNALGVPLAPHKISKPSHATIFLGIKLDSIAQCASLPKEKISQYKIDIYAIRNRKFLTVKMLQSIIGKLSFAASVVPGRPFIRRLINLLPKSLNTRFIYLNKAAKRDLEMWLSFLDNYNGITFFRSLNIIQGSAYNLYSDASKKGFGATSGPQWIQAAYPAEWGELHISILEFYPILVLIHMFGKYYANSVVIFHCDNEGVCFILNNCTTKDPIILYFLRQLILLLIEHNIDLRTVHIPGKTNILSDRISRFQVTDGLLREYNMNLMQTPIPKQLLPSHSILKKIETS